MAKPLPRVSGIFPPPSRELAIDMIRRALLEVRSNYGLSWARIAEHTGIGKDALERARTGASLIEFESVARLGYYFPDEFELIETLWQNSVPTQPTRDDRIDRIYAELDAMRREQAQ